MASVAMAVQSATASVRMEQKNSKNSPLRAALKSAKLEQYYDKLTAEGIVDPAELSLVSTQDLDRIGLKKFEKMRFARNFLIGGGGSMHSNGGGSSGGGGGLLDLPLSALDQQALLQLLTPFLASNGAVKGGNAAAVKQLMAGYERATANGIVLSSNADEATRQLAQTMAAAGQLGGTVSSRQIIHHGNGGGNGSGRSSSISGSSSSPNSRDMVSLLFKRGADQNSSKSDRLQAVKAIRTLLSAERDDIAVSIIEQNLLPNLVKFLESNDADVQLEALSALTNLVVSQADHTHFLIGTGVVPVLVNLLKESDGKSEEILEKAVWVLGNIAGDSAVTRDAVLAGGALVPMIGIIDRSCQQKSMRLLRVSVWCVSNLCDGPSMLPTFPAKSVIGAMIQALGSSTDADVISHACWALSHLCDGPSPHVQSVVDADVCEALTVLLSHRSWRVVKPALRTIGNIVCAEDEVDYTQHIVDHNTVPYLRRLVEHSNREIQKEACWTFSNIAAGTVPQIQCVLDSGAIDPLVALASSKKTDPDVKIEACWVLLNATSCGSDQQIEFLVEHGCVGVLCDLLSHPNMLIMAVEGLEKLLLVGDEAACRLAKVKKTDDPMCGPNMHASKMDLHKLEECEKHEASSISKRVGKMLKTHFVCCAICKERYPARTPNTKFCNECKCMVCSKCNCEVYHLSYQLAQWDGVDAEEKKKESSKAASKKKKRQKKKAKQKQRKDKKRSKATNENQHSLYAEDHDGAKSRSPSASPLKSPDSPPTHARGMSSTSLNNATGGNDGGAGSDVGNAAMQSGPRSRKRGGRSMNGRQRGSEKGTRGDQRDTSDASAMSGAKQEISGGSSSTKRRTTGSHTATATPPTLRASSADMEENDKLVSFFEQTGSILDLANFLDENGEDDGMSAEELAELQREMQAMKQ
jgi:importin subunit alpha-6/7